MIKGQAKQEAKARPCGSKWVTRAVFHEQMALSYKSMARAEKALGDFDRVLKQLEILLK